MKKKLSLVCVVAILSLNVFSISSLLSKHSSLNIVKNNIDKKICAGEKVDSPPINIHSVRPKFI